MNDLLIKLNKGDLVRLTHGDLPGPPNPIIGVVLDDWNIAYGVTVAVRWLNAPGPSWRSHYTRLAKLASKEG